MKMTKGLISVPDKEIVECEIETPQRMNGKFHIRKRQTGAFYTSTLKFVSSELWGGHDITFDSMEEFQKVLVKVF